MVLRMDSNMGNYPLLNLMMRDRDIDLRARLTLTLNNKRLAFLHPGNQVKDRFYKITQAGKNFEHLKVAVTLESPKLMLHFC